MWIDYFQYEYCIADDLLFIKGYAENENKKLSFTIPIGASSLSHGISLLRNIVTIIIYRYFYRQFLKKVKDK